MPLAIRFSLMRGVRPTACKMLSQRIVAPYSRPDRLYLDTPSAKSRVLALKICYSILSHEQRIITRDEAGPGRPEGRAVDGHPGGKQPAQGGAEGRAAGGDARHRNASFEGLLRLYREHSEASQRVRSLRRLATRAAGHVGE